MQTNTPSFWISHLFDGVSHCSFWRSFSRHLCFCFGLLSFSLSSRTLARSGDAPAACCLSRCCCSSAVLSRCAALAPSPAAVSSSPAWASPSGGWRVRHGARPTWCRRFLLVIHLFLLLFQSRCLCRSETDLGSQASALTSGRVTVA